MIIKLQLMLSLAMLPLTLLFFGTASLTSPVANLFAIPWVSLVIVPLSLLGLIAMPFSTFISSKIFNLAAIAIDYLFKGFEILSESSLAQFHPVEIPAPLLMLAFAGLLFLLLPKGFPARWLGMIFMLPALAFIPDKPQQGEFSYTLLDAGQGMASVVQTAGHTLVYDAGTRFSESFDIGKLVVEPYLRAKGLSTVDTLMISHEDNDHRGGAKYLTKMLQINEIISSDTTILKDLVVKACVRGQNWQWDGVDFEILSPPPDYPQNDNNRSCVLRISNSFHSLLLTADIERLTEKLLIDTYVDEHLDKLKSEVVSVPHHGSKTSSTREFIQAVSPKIGLIAAGYRSRFGHPKAEIVERYQSMNVKLLNTVNSGAISLHFTDNEKPITIDSYRINNRRFWNR
jgi:competence protein ComEC